MKKLITILFTIGLTATAFSNNYLAEVTSHTNNMYVSAKGTIIITRLCNETATDPRPVILNYIGSIPFQMIFVDNGEKCSIDTVVDPETTGQK